MLEFLVADVIGDVQELLESHGTQIVASVPAKRLMARVPVTIGKSSARAFKTLHQTRHVVGGRELEQEVDVIGNDAEFDDARTVALGLSKQEPLEEGCDRLVYQGQASPAGPGEVGVDADWHDSKLAKEAMKGTTNRAHPASLRTRVVAEPAL